MSEQEQPIEKTFEELEEEYQDTPLGSVEEVEALERMGEKASTQEQWQIVFDNAYIDSELEARAKAELAKFDQ